MVKVNIIVKRLLIAAAAFAALRYLTPFVIALLVAALIEPAAAKLCGKGLKRGFVAAIATITFYGGFGTVALLLCWRGGLWLFNVAKSLPAKLAPLPALLKSGEAGLERFIVAAPEEFQQYLRTAMDTIRVAAEDLPVRIYDGVMGALGTVLSAAPGIALFFTAAAIGTFFISAGYEEVSRFITKQLPAPKRGSVRAALGECVAAVKHWAGAELTMAALSFCQLLMFFFILGVSSPIFGALAVALIDALPLFGTGVVLVPWALLCVISGESGKAAVLIAAYITVAVVRSLLEPKLLGEGSGVHPAAALLAIYCGFRVMGVAGMLIFPLSLMILKRLHDLGYVELWK